MVGVVRYFSDLSRAWGEGWNHFWFRPDDLVGLCLLRIPVGLIGVWWLLAFCFDLTLWFGPNGIAPTERIQQMLGGGESIGLFHFSFLHLARTETSLWIAHVASIIVFVASAGTVIS